MNRIARLFAAGLFAAAFAPVAPTAAGVVAVPSPANSSVPDCMALCPLGDMPFAVTVRDLANVPIVGSTVVLDFSGCPNAYICPQHPGDPYLIDVPGRTVRMFTDATGKVTFPARIGGVGPAGCAQVFADGILLRTVALASPDQNGNGVAVGIVDVDPALFAAKLGTTDPTADFDCNGIVDAADELIFYQHLSHSCDGYVDAVQRRTWGSLKTHYR
jgi:hypothetical protein